MTARRSINTRRFGRRNRAGLVQSCIQNLEERRLLSVSFYQGASLNTGAIGSVVADLNGDAKPDIIDFGGQPGGAYQVQVFTNQGNGTFAPANDLPYSASSANAVAVGDFNGDGIPDIAVLDTNDAIVTCYLGASTNVSGATPTFQSPVVSSFGTAKPGAYFLPSEMQTAHFSGTMDGLVVDDNNGSSIIRALTPTGGGSFTTGAANILTDPQGNDIFGITTFAIADLNGDGISDIAYAGGTGVVVQFGTASGTFLTTQKSYDVSGGVGGIIAAPLASSAGLPDLVCNTGNTTGGISVLLNNGDGTFAAAVNYPVDSSVYDTVGDFDGNGSIDIAAGSQILLNTGHGAFASAQDDNLPNISVDTLDNSTLNAGDFNADGNADMLVGGDTIYLEGSNSNGGGGGTTTGGSNLSGTLTGSAPSSAIAGQKARINQKLTITDSSGADVTGNVTAALYLSSDGTINANSVSLESITKQLHLKSGKHVNLNLHAKFIPATTPNGNYHLVAQITDPTGATTDVTSSAITVAPPQIDLSGAFSKTPKPGKNGKTRLSLSLSNNGNIPAAGNLKINIDSSPTASSTGATVIASPAKKINLKNGKTQKLSLPVTLPAGTYFLVIQLDPNNTFNDVNLANNVFATSAVIAVG